ncbi:MAG: hypothetical protein N2Z22_03095 [Turneriella sp.]|nr:hypothetical protein [Leptospiraceae bacterium]MCX7632303.1 hypothetical protein [Turneriella sp.]
MDVLKPFFLAAAIFVANPPPTVWVKKIFTGGPQCQSYGSPQFFTPPGFLEEKERLTKLMVKILRNFYRDHPVCQACGCPRYHREILFEILADGVDKARQLGYDITTAPEDQELLDFARSKLYQPPPDVPNED